MSNILIIDDDKGLAEPLQTYFKRYAMTLSHSMRPSDGMKLLAENHYDLLILDIMLPEKDGFEVLKEVRSLPDIGDIPIIMLTARGEVSDRVVGLELGADDYLPKPFDPRELVARIKRILKRGAPRSSSVNKQTGVLNFGTLSVNMLQQNAMMAQQDLNLTGHEFALLSLLCTAHGALISRDKIMAEVNGIEADIYSRSVDVLVSRLRQKLKPLVAIKTLRGKGYQWVLAQSISQSKAENA